MSTFTASVVTLSALAFNHYVGIVYPLHRNAITPRTVKWTVILAYSIPLSIYLAIFTIFPGGWKCQLTETKFLFQDSVLRLHLHSSIAMAVREIQFIVSLHVRGPRARGRGSTTHLQRSLRYLRVFLCRKQLFSCLPSRPIHLLYRNVIVPLPSYPDPHAKRLTRSIVEQQQ